MASFNISMDRMGSVIVAWNSASLQDRVKAVVLDNGGIWHDAAYIRGGIADLPIELSSSQIKDLEQGWDIDVYADAWVMAHCWGYDAQKAFEIKRPVKA